MTVFCENYEGRAGVLQLKLRTIPVALLSRAEQCRGLRLLSSSGTQRRRACGRTCTLTRTYTHIQNPGAQQDVLSGFHFLKIKLLTSQRRDSSAILPCTQQGGGGGRWEGKMRAGVEAGRGEGEVGKRAGRERQGAAFQ